MKLCKDISCITHNNQTKPTKGTLILFSRCIFSFPLLTLPWHRIVKVQLRVINKLYVVNRLVDGVKRYYVLIK